jgi:hypothetical protein
MCVHNNPLNNNNNNKHNQSDQVKEDEMGRACSTNRGEEECIYDIGGKARRKETILKWILER